MEKIVEFTPAYDKTDPDPKKSYGIHCVDLRMILKGSKGAVQFVLYTGWYLPTVKSTVLPNPMPADLGYHSRIQMYEDQTARDGCPYCDGQPCYYDGSVLNSYRMYDILLKEGSDGVWKALEEYYSEIFGGIA